MTHTFSTQAPHELIDQNTALFWFRRDLRIEDNMGLTQALKENSRVLPIFIFDTCILDQLENKSDRRVAFILDAVRKLHEDLRQHGSTLIVLRGDPVRIFKSLTPKVVYANHDYEPYAIIRDQQVSDILKQQSSALKTFKDQVIFEKNEILKDDGAPYTVFTPYSKKWKSTLEDKHTKSESATRYLDHLVKIAPAPIPTLQQIGFKSDASFEYPERKIPLAIIRQYHKNRDYPAVPGTTRLSVHLRFGTVSIRRLVQLALHENETWLNELIWREFYHMILWHFPHVSDRSFKPAYDRIEWRNDPKDFEAWCQGKTGYPIVDAGMRELNATGFMHNRVRMIVASFLTKHLLIDWRWGEAYFAKQLLDFDLAANNGGWQWAAGSGCDAAPYFRIFNPYLQTSKFDPDGEYIQRWVPEWNSSTYTKPIVEHAMARDRALVTYKSALEKMN